MSIKKIIKSIFLLAALTLIGSQMAVAAQGDCSYDPDSAVLPCVDDAPRTPPKKTIKYDEDCAKLYGCSDSVQRNKSFKQKEKRKPIFPFSSRQSRGGDTASCGSSHSISAALDQCGKQGHTFALCKKKGSVWNCSPSSDQADSRVRPTGFKAKR